MSVEQRRDVEIAPNPIESRDAGLARAFEQAVLQALGQHPTEPLVVRFGVWDGEEEGPRFVCKIEASPRAAVAATPAWRWWSPLVRTPGELADHVRQATQVRSPRVAARMPAAPPRSEFWGWGTVGQAGA